MFLLLSHLLLRAVAMLEPISIPPELAMSSDQFDEKTAREATAQTHPADDDEDEDMDALIDELESHDGHQEDEDVEGQDAANARTVSEDLLQTDTRSGLTELEVLARRKKFGPNQMKEEKENMILKFMGYFIGPIQFVMEVGFYSWLFVGVYRERD